MKTITDNFKKNIESVERLINFDRDVLDMALSQVQELHNDLVTSQGITNEQLNGKRTIDLLQNIRTNDSLKLRYSTINNQAIVLLVSYFGASVADLFRQAAQISITDHSDKDVLDTELRFKIKELQELGGAIEEKIGDLLITKNGISFQDMQSIQREFKKYFKIQIEKSQHVNNIILGQACRNTIAHEGGLINKRVINQVKDATPRGLKLDLVLGETVSFTEKELKVVSDSMLAYVYSLESQVNEYRGKISHM